MRHIWEPDHGFKNSYDNNNREYNYLIEFWRLEFKNRFTNKPADIKAWVDFAEEKFSFEIECIDCFIINLQLAFFIQEITMGK